MVTTIGVQTSTSTRSGPSNVGTVQGRLHIAGLTERGPIDRPVVVQSLGDYVTQLGARTSYSNAMYDTARTFFEEGGSELVVSRVVGPAATVGVLTLMDGAGTPVPTLAIESRDPGSFASTFSADVTTTGATYTLNVYRAGERIARYVGLTSPAAAVQAAASDPYISIRDLGSATVAPGNNPKTVAVTAMSGGSDDRASVTVTNVIAALDAADETAIGGAVAAPGYGADVIGALLLDHALRTKKIAILAGDIDSTPTELTTLAATLQAGPAGQYGGLFYPHLVIPDGSGSRTVSPEGYVAAARARAFTLEGFWQVPAGDRARARWVMGTVSPVSQDLNNTLNDGFVNGIVTTNGRVRLYNWTSLASDRENFQLLSSRDVLNNLSIIVANTLEPYVWSTMDGKGYLLGFIRAAVTGVLEPIAGQGGFFARYNADDELVDNGYSVIVDRSNNPVQSLADNTVMVSVSVRLSPTAALIQAEIIKVALTAAV